MFNILFPRNMHSHIEMLLNFKYFLFLLQNTEYSRIFCVVCILFFFLLRFVLSHQNMKFIATALTTNLDLKTNSKFFFSFCFLYSFANLLQKQTKFLNDCLSFFQTSSRCLVSGSCLFKDFDFVCSFSRDYLNRKCVMQFIIVKHKCL